MAALQAAAESSARGDHHGARTHLLEVCSLGDMREAATEDRLELFEQLGDACSMLRHTDEAQEAYTTALEIAMADALPDVARLRRKLAGVSDPRALEQAPVRPRAGVVTGAQRDERHHDDDVRRRARVRAARRDRAGRPHPRPPRPASRRGSTSPAPSTSPAASSARCTRRSRPPWPSGPTPAERLSAEVIRHTPSVLLGGARTAREPLETAGRVAAELGEERAGLAPAGHARRSSRTTSASPRSTTCGRCCASGC